MAFNLLAMASTEHSVFLASVALCSSCRADASLGLTPSTQLLGLGITISLESYMQQVRSQSGLVNWKA